MQDLACGFRRQETGCAGEGIDEASYCAFRRQGDGAGRKKSGEEDSVPSPAVAAISSCGLMTADARQQMRSEEHTSELQSPS